MSDSLLIEEDLKSGEEFLFKWNKHFSYLTINDVMTKVILDNESLSIETSNRYLGLIPGSTKVKKLPLGNVSSLVTKKIINLFDMLLGIAFSIVGIFQPLFFIVAAIIFWTGISNKIIINTNLQNKIIIPTDSKEDAEKFIEFINSIPMKK